ncbi:hypothetical protein [Streptomyces venezuelae]|uniref:hypothetical protein n=1 Tax=Streptomyces venezuelae TaxID=54571 RepID=UPI00168582C3|nr:hypothetical protein [Streptomyces venezuelae]
MSFEEEWATARSTAVSETRMRLNAVDDGSGNRGLGRGLKVTSSVLNQRADKADIVREDFLKADNAAMTETAQVGPSLKGFESGPAFANFIDRWKSQMAYVEKLVQNDVAGALRRSAQTFTEREKKERDRARNEHQGQDLK